MKAKELWDRFAAETGIEAAYDVWAFCGGGEMGDQLAQLTLDGVKTATASPHIAYGLEGVPIPEVGCYSVVEFSDGEAACIIRDTKVSIVPFGAVSAEHAYLEGEGDRSLSYWRRVHKEVFLPDHEAAGTPFTEDSLCVLEEFEVVYRP